jgi:holin-like protein
MDYSLEWRGTTVAVRRRWRQSRLGQLAAIGLVWLLGELVVRSTGLPLPGGLVGMALLLALLAAGVVRVASWRRGASWLIAEMLLFFVPAGLAVLDHPELFGWLGLKLLAVIAGGTLVVMAATALAVEFMLRRSAVQP